MAEKYEAGLNGNLRSVSRDVQTALAKPLRELAMDYVSVLKSKDAGQFAFFKAMLAYDKGISESSLNISSYVRSMRQNAKWGGMPEMVLLNDLFGVTTQVNDNQGQAQKLANGAVLGFSNPSGVHWTTSPVIVC